MASRNLTATSARPPTRDVELEEARSESHQLERLTRSLATCRAASELAEIAVRELRQALHADALALFLLNEENRFDLIAEIGCTEKFKREWKSIPHDLVPLKPCFSFAEGLFVGTSNGLRERIPSAGELIDNAHRETICYAPLIVQDAVIGFIGYSYNAPMDLKIRAEYVHILFGQCAHALDAARLRELSRNREFEAQLSHQAKSDFLATICHEIRTPVGVIKGFADMLCESSRLEDESRRWAQTIQRNSQTLIELVGEVLDFSAAEARELESEVAPFDLNDMVAGIDACVRFKASERGLRFVITSRNFPRMVASDHGKIRQIILTMINNAINFTDRGKVLVDLDWQKGKLQCTVADSGCGVASSHRVGIFKLRPRGGHEHLRHFGGNKVGLATARSIARSLGGDLELTQSSLGVGSIFTLRVPCAEHVERRVQADPKAASSQLNLQGTRILLVEDCVDNQDLITHLLSRFGATVQIADSGTSGLEMALHQEFDLILLDIQLPEMDGRQVLKNLRTLGYKRPIAALTALAIKGEKDKAMAEGFDAYLTKPIHLAELLKTVKTLTQELHVH